MRRIVIFNEHSFSFSSQSSNLVELSTSSPITVDAIGVTAPPSDPPYTLPIPSSDRLATGSPSMVEMATGVSGLLPRVNNQLSDPLKNSEDAQLP